MAMLVAQLAQYSAEWKQQIYQASSTNISDAPDVSDA